MKLSSFGLAKYNKLFPIWNYQLDVFPAGGLAQLLERWNEERDVAVRFPGPDQY